MAWCSDPKRPRDGGEAFDAGRWWPSLFSGEVHLIISHRGLLEALFEATRNHSCDARSLAEAKLVSIAKQNKKYSYRRPTAVCSLSIIQTLIDLAVI
jgi:hypothetical protein